MYLRLTRDVVILSSRTGVFHLPFNFFGDTTVETVLFVCQGCSAPFVTCHGFHYASTAGRGVLSDFAEICAFKSATLAPLLCIRICRAAST